MLHDLPYAMGANHVISSRESFIERLYGHWRQNSRGCNMRCQCSDAVNFISYYLVHYLSSEIFYRLNVIRFFMSQFNPCNTLRVSRSLIGEIFYYIALVLSC